MKAPELYRHLRAGLGAWFKAQGFQRAPKAQLGWHRGHDLGDVGRGEEVHEAGHHLTLPQHAVLPGLHHLRDGRVHRHGAMLDLRRDKGTPPGGH